MSYTIRVLSCFSSGATREDCLGSSLLLPGWPPVASPTKAQWMLWWKRLQKEGTGCWCIRNKHIMIDLGTGNNNKINWAMEDKQEMIDIIETVYRGARKGRGLVVSPKDYSTKYRY
ncbi:thioredoxin-like protein 4A isoform X2 [Zalophus californianus]|uniref:Thioredoxin-like protein 4A isoform X2 n=1 Tax=Zalophus californianus TaxID=9704 RepID=A0A6J2DLR8_ZALCA|nr:thioredoxin-like protein 4A isoform X2 [Zalophus californianus]